MERKTELMHWLSVDCQLSSFTLQAMPGDASFRRYFRVYLSSRSFVAMDAPPQRENCRLFIAIAQALRQHGLHTPEIIAAKIEQGFLLMTDFGDQTYLKALSAENADLLYQRALTALVRLQNCRQVSGHPVPSFTCDFMLKEWDWHKEWFLNKLLNLSHAALEKDLDQCYHLLVEAAASQPQVFMHRDYHSANLMVLPQNEVGILDFQDAFIGPVTYDLVSLLRDCYIDWPQAKVESWVFHYLQQLQKTGELGDVNADIFLRWFDWMGMQRHLKALLTFARKHVRDHQSHYLRFIPRTLNYLVNTSQRYPELTILHDYLRVTVQPTFARTYLCAR